MGYIAPSCTLAIPTMTEETERNGGNALVTPAKRGAVDRGEWWIWLFLDLCSLLLLYFKASLLKWYIPFLTHLWDFQAFLSPATSISFLFITHITSFCFPTHAWIFIFIIWIHQEVFFPSSTPTVYEFTECQGNMAKGTSWGQGLHHSAPKLSPLSHVMLVFSVLFAAPVNSFSYAGECQLHTGSNHDIWGNDIFIPPLTF